MRILKPLLFFAILGLLAGCSGAPKVVIAPNKIELSPALAHKKDDKVKGSEPTAEYYFGLGEYAYYEKKYKDAYEYYLNASFFDGQSELVNQKLILVIYRIIYTDKKFFARWNKLRNSYFLDLDKSSSLEFLSGIFNYLDGNYKIASHYLIKEVVDNGNKSKPLLNFLLFTLHRAKLYEQEMAVAQLANKSYPDDVKFRNWYAYSIVINQKQEYFSFAESLLEECVLQEPENIYYWDSMMWLYYKWGKQKDAYALAKSKFAGDQVSKEAEILLHLGYVYLGQAKPAEAKKFFKLVLKLKSAELSQEAQEQLELLQTGEKK